MKNKLLIKELVIFQFILGLMVFFGVLSFITRIKVEKSLKENTSEIICKEKIEVFIYGAVKREGIYEFDPGTTVRFILKNISLKENANVSKVESKKVFYSSGELYIPQKIKK